MRWLTFGFYFERIAQLARGESSRRAHSRGAPRIGPTLSGHYALFSRADPIRQEAGEGGCLFCLLACLASPRGKHP